MNRRHLSFATLATGLAALSLCPLTAAAWETTGGSWGNRVEGSGKMVDEQRTVPAFSRIRFSDSIDFKARQGSGNTVTVHADDNLLPLILTVVEGDTLTIKTKPGTGYRSHGRVEVRLEFAQLASLSMQGSGDGEIEGAKGEALEVAMAGSGDLKLRSAAVGKLSVNLAGSGDVQLSGKCQQLAVSIAGSGDIDASALPCATASVSVAGSGDVRVNANETLNVQIAGSGDVSYSGNPPKITKSVLGSGSLTKAR
jgi:hypothetical protein